MVRKIIFIKGAQPPKPKPTRQPKPVHAYLRELLSLVVVRRRSQR